MNSILAILISGLFIFVYALLLICSYQRGMSPSNGYKTAGWYRLIFFFFVCLGFILCLYIVLQNHFIYYWDYGGYWTSSYNTMKELFANPAETVRSVYSSILTNDYNNLLPLLVALPLKIFGYTFSRYVVLNYILFLVPSWILAISIIYKQILTCHPMLRTTRLRYLVFLGIAFLVSTFTPLYYAMLHGYIDIACITPSLLAILLFMDYKPLLLTKGQVARDILIALLILMSFLFRRYFAYFCVGYGTALFAYTIYMIMKVYNEADWKRKATNGICNLLIIGISMIGILLIFFRRLVFRILENNYANQYEGYDADFLSKINGIITQLGYATIFLAIAAIILSFIAKKALKITLFLACSVITTTMIFFGVQAMGEHHLYTIAGQMLILMILGLYQIVSLIHDKKALIFVALLISTILGIGTINCFFLVARPYLSSISWMYAQKYYPMQRNDIATLHQLADYLNNLTIGTNKYVYICASGSTLNASIMNSLDKPYSNNSLNNMYWTADVDMRDGFNADFLKAHYVVVTDPVQLHLREGTQEVVRFLCQEVSDMASPIGKHYEKLNQTFVLDNNVSVYIYMKTSDYDIADYQYLADYYDNYYPGNKELFSSRIWDAVYR